MAIAIDFLLSRLFFTSSSLYSLRNRHSQTPMLLFLVFFIFSLCFLLISLFKLLKRARLEEEKSKSKSSCKYLSIFRFSFPSTINKAHYQASKTTHYPILFLETLMSKLPKLTSLIASFSRHSSIECDGAVENECIDDGSELGGVDLVGEGCGKVEEQSVKRKKKRAKKKKKSNLHAEDVGIVETQLRALQGKNGSDSFFYPFTSSSSVTQRKIKMQYDQLVKSHDSKALTLAQVSQFVNCLVEARNDLQHKSEIIQRKFTITKALLYKADRSSFDRLSQQIYKLEAEQKRLEEDALVYNRLQQQLKLSPAYKQMIEIGARMELKASSDQLVDTTDAEFACISFEELLAQEKKDTFWQKNGKLRSCTN